MGGRGAKVAGPTVSLMIGCSSNVWNGGGCGRIHSSVRHVLHPALRERPARLSRRADADTGSAGAGGWRGSGMEGERDGGSAGSVTSGFPYPGVSRSGLRRGRTRALLARPRFSAMGKSVWRRPRPRHGHDPDKRAPPRYPAARIHTTCASGALPSPGRRASGDAPLPPPPRPFMPSPHLFLRVQFQLDHHHASAGCGAKRYPCCRSAPSSAPGPTSPRGRSRTCARLRWRARPPAARTERHWHSAGGEGARWRRSCGRRGGASDAGTGCAMGPLCESRDAPAGRQAARGMRVATPSLAGGLLCQALLGSRSRGRPSEGTKPVAADHNPGGFALSRR